MKKINATINSVQVILYVPEDLHEYREGARLIDGGLEYNTGMLFNFSSKQQILMENSNVPDDLRILYFNDFSKYGIVLETQDMDKNTYGPYTSSGLYSICLELKKNFCEAHGVTVGSFLILEETLHG